MINYHWLEKSDISVTSRQTTILWSRKISKLLRPWRLKVLPEAKAAPPHWPSCTSCSKTNHNTQVGRSSHRFIHSSKLWKLLPNFGNDVATSVRHLLRQTKTLQLSAFCFCCCLLFFCPDVRTTNRRPIDNRSHQLERGNRVEHNWSQALWAFEHQIRNYWSQRRMSQEGLKMIPGPNAENQQPLGKSALYVS